MKSYRYILGLIVRRLVWCSWAKYRSYSGCITSVRWWRSASPQCTAGYMWFCPSSRDLNSALCLPAGFVSSSHLSQAPCFLSVSFFDVLLSDAKCIAYLKFLQSSCYAHCPALGGGLGASVSLMSVWRRLTSVTYIRLDGAYWLIGPGSAGLAQGCRCALPLQAWAGAYCGGLPHSLLRSIYALNPTTDNCL